MNFGECRQFEFAASASWDLTKQSTALRTGVEYRLNKWGFLTQTNKLAPHYIDIEFEVVPHHKVGLLQVFLEEFENSL